MPHTRIKEMNVEKNEILLIYDSKKIEERRLLGYAKSLQQYKIKEFDVQTNSFTELQLKQVAERLKVPVSDLLDPTTKVYREKINDAKMGSESIIKSISNNPSLIKTPIALYNDKAEFVSSSFRFIKKDMTDGKTTSNKIQQGDL